jgi:hypothetical protein
MNYFTSLCIVIGFEGIFFVFIVVCLVLTFYMFKTFFKVRSMILKTVEQPVMGDYIPKSGDILLFQWENTGGMYHVPFIRYYPTHVGMVWNRKKPLYGESSIIEKDNKNDVFILEMNHFRNQPNSYKFSQNEIKGLRAIKFWDFIETMQGIVYVRQITKEIESQKIENLLLKCGHIFFEPRVSQMTWLSTFAIGWRPVFPTFSDMCGYNLKFYEKNYTDEKKSFFCSEFLIWFLQKLDCVDKNLKDYYKISPGCFLSATERIENLFTVKFKKEKIILKRY